MKKIITIVVIFLALEEARATTGDAIRDGDLAAGAEGSSCQWEYEDPCTGARSCYFLVEEKHVFVSAENQCVIRYNGHLAAPNTVEENLFLRMKLIEHYTNDQSGTHTVWIGALGDNGEWSFPSGETFDFADWGPNQPETDHGVSCAALKGHVDTNYYFQWNDFDCTKQTFFICEQN